MYVGRKEVGFGDKMRLFDAVSRSVVCYACQVWGASVYDDVEKMKRWFVKRVLGLPRWTPDYVVYLEIGSVPVYLYTLRCQMGYLRKVLFGMDEGRLPRYLAEGMMGEGIGWVEEWEGICGRHGIVMGRDMGLNEFDRLTETMLGTEAEWIRCVNIERARSGRRHGCYSELRYDVNGGYWGEGMNVHRIGTIVKVRGGLLDLNANVWRMDGRRRCSLCNLGEEESVLHFLCVCPVLGDVRRGCFGEGRLSRERGLGILNGEDWDRLYEYVCMAMRERGYLVGMFNF
jgi:hypothetical protein